MWDANLITGDFNGDGKVDIGVPHADIWGAPGGTEMLYGNSDGTFQPAIVPTDLNSFTPANRRISGTSAERTCSVATKWR